jgi:hemolysin III
MEDPLPTVSKADAYGHRPLFRGRLHLIAALIALPAGIALVLAADTVQGRVAAIIYSLSLLAVFSVSAAYHRLARSPSSVKWFRRLDHSMIFLLIAGTVTPFAVLVLNGALATAVLIAVWTAAAAGIIVETIWIEAPKWFSAAVYVAVGCLAIVALPAIVSAAGVGAGLLIAAGGLLYVIGAVIYARQRPDPSPSVFGYHEIFHVLVVAAAAAHFAAVAVYAGAAA